MMCCTKYNTCLNYKIRCADCKANSDVYNHYPLYKDRDLVEVVRCGQCKHATEDIIVEGVCYCHKIQQGMFLDGFCNYGERKCDNA